MKALMIVCGLALLWLIAGLTACTEQSATVVPSIDTTETLMEDTVVTLGNGETWTTEDNVTFAVTWTGKGPDPAYELLTGEPGRSYVEVTVQVTNGSAGPVKGVMTQVSFDGAGATVDFSGPQGTIPDVLPGKSATLIESYVPGTEIQVQVMTYPMTLHEAYWVGSV